MDADCVKAVPDGAKNAGSRLGDRAVQIEKKGGVVGHRDLGSNKSD